MIYLYSKIGRNSLKFFELISLECKQTYLHKVDIEPIFLQYVNWYLATLFEDKRWTKETSHSLHGQIKPR